MGARSSLIVALFPSGPLSAVVVVVDLVDAALPLDLGLTCNIRLLFRTDTNDLTGGVRRGSGAVVISDTLALSSIK